jgi:hypothetical protein
MYDDFEWRLATQRSPLFQFAVSWDPRVSVHCTAVTVRYSVTLFKESIGFVSLNPLTRVRSNKHVVHCTSKFCWWNWRQFVLDIVLDIAFSAWIISIIFILYVANKSANRNGSNKADELIAILCFTVLLSKGFWFLAGAQVFKKCSNILHIGVIFCSEKNGPNYFIHTQNTPHMNLKHHVVVVRGLTWQIRYSEISRILFSETKFHH